MTALHWVVCAAVALVTWFLSSRPRLIAVLLLALYGCAGAEAVQVSVVVGLHLIAFGCALCWLIWDASSGRKVRSS